MMNRRAFLRFLPALPFIPITLQQATRGRTALELLQAKHGQLTFTAYKAGTGWKGYYEAWFPKTGQNVVVAYLDDARSVWTWMQNGTLTAFKEGQRMVRLP